MSFQELINTFLSECDVNAISRNNYKKWLRPFHRYVVNNSIDILKIKRPHIIQYKEYLKKTHADKTVNCYLTAIRMFFNWTEENGYHETNPANGVKMLRIMKAYRKQPLTMAQYAALYNSCDDTPTGWRNKVMIELMVTLGLRAVEVSRLSQADHYDNNHIRIQGKGHSSKDAVMEVSDKLSNDIHKQQQKGSIWIFSGKHGAQLTSAYIARIVSNQMKHAGIKSDTISCHSLRHTCAVMMMIKTNNNIYATQQWLRHTSSKTTEIYIQAISKDNAWQHSITNGLTDMLTQARKQSDNGNNDTKA